MKNIQLTEGSKVYLSLQVKGLRETLLRIVGSQVCFLTFDEPETNRNDQHDTKHSNRPVHVGYRRIWRTREQEEDGRYTTVDKSNDVDDVAETSKAELSTGWNLIPSDNEYGDDR